MGEPAHDHESVWWPGDPRDRGHRSVEQQLLNAVVGAAIAGCAPCVDRLLLEVAADPAALACLVLLAQSPALLLHRDELPRHAADHIPDVRGAFEHLMRDGATFEAVTDACRRLPSIERRATARFALETLTNTLAFAGIVEDLAPPASTILLRCSQDLVYRVLAIKSSEAFTTRWRRHLSAVSWDPALADAEIEAVVLLLGAVLHHQAQEDHLAADRIPGLVFSRVLPVLRDAERVGLILAAFTPSDRHPIAEITAPVKRLIRSRPALLDDLRDFAAYIVTTAVGSCPHGLRDAEHACTLAHRVHSHNGGARPAPETTQRVALPSIGYRVETITEGPPAGWSRNTWQVSQVLLERWESNTARWNQTLAGDLTMSRPSYEPEGGLEALACPTCSGAGPFVAEGAWGDPLTLHCFCGVSIMSPSSAGPDDFGRLLLKRLILREADPAHEARRLMQPLAEYQERRNRLVNEDWAQGLHDEDIALAAAIDRGSDDLVVALNDALNPVLPRRHEGRPFTLLLLQALDALSVPAVRDSEEGRKLAGAVRALVDDLKQESDPRPRPSSQPGPPPPGETPCDQVAE